MLFNRRRNQARLFDMSEEHLEKFTMQGHLQNYLRYLARGSVQYHMDDFDGDAINLDYYAVANSSGTSAADFATSVAHLGIIQGDTGTDDNGSISLVGPIIYKGDTNCGMEIRFKIDVVTGLNFEVGFIDAVPGSNAGGITDEDTPTFAAGDAALIGMDTDETLTGLYYASVGSVASGTDAVTAFGTVTTPTANAYMTARIQLVGNFCYFSVWNESTGVREFAALDTDADGHIEGGTLLAPWVYVRTRNTTAKFFDIDYLATWQDRRTT